MSKYVLHLVSVSPTPQTRETSMLYVTRRGQDAASNRVIHHCSVRKGMDVMVPLKRKTLGGAKRLTGFCAHCGYRLVIQA